MKKQVAFHCWRNSRRVWNMRCTYHRSFIQRVPSVPPPPPPPRIDFLRRIVLFAENTDGINPRRPRVSTCRVCVYVKNCRRSFARFRFALICTARGDLQSDSKFEKEKENFSDRLKSFGISEYRARSKSVHYFRAERRLYNVMIKSSSRKY